MACCNSMMVREYGLGSCVRAEVSCGARLVFDEHRLSHRHSHALSYGPGNGIRASACGPRNDQAYRLVGISYSGARSASKIGSSTSSAAVWTTRSVIVGTPSGRSFSLFGFGSQTRLTACGS